MHKQGRTQAVRAGEELDWQALDKFLQANIAGLGSPAKISQYPDGKSNLTYRLQYPGADLVVRRPPFGSKVSSAHSMGREYRIMSKLRPVFPVVPETLAYSDDESIIGSEFYVMRCVPGQVARKSKLPDHWRFTRNDTRKFCIAFWMRLIELHQVDYVAAGLADFGRPQAYARRQIEGWNARMQSAATPDGETFKDVQRWLCDSLPDKEPAAAILHGDYRLDNVILDTDDPFKIIALLDWEISALGNPLMDLGNALAYWIEPDDVDCLKVIMMQPSSVPGMLKRSEILALYAEKTAIDVSNFNFYYTYGIFRNLVILQQIYYRFYHGKTQDKRFREFGSLVQALGKHCRSLCHDAGRS